VYDTATGETVWETGFNSSNTIYGLAFVDNDILVASHSQVQIYRISKKQTLYDTGEEHTTYGFDLAAGRLVMPLRSGGALINQTPSEDDNALPHAIMESLENFNPDDLVETTTLLPLAGNWNGSSFGFFDEEGNQITIELDEPGLAYVFDGEGYILHPTKGLSLPYVYISPDGNWQAMIRGEEVDVFRAKEGPEPVLTIPGNGFDRRYLAIYGDMMAAGSYVENLSIFDLNTGECMRTLETGAMCDKIQFSADGKHIIALSGMSERATVISTENWEIIMRFLIPGLKYGNPQAYKVGFSQDGSKAIVLYPDGSAEIGLLYQDLDTLVEKARKFTAID
jgi:WD40 repeat protein